MKRREFIALISAAAAWPVAPDAQQVSKIHRIGLVFATSPVSDMVGSDPIHPLARAFVHGLRDLGYVEGRNLVLERRSAEGRFERSPAIIRELIASNVDVIISPNNVITKAAQSVTRTIPIVLPTGGHPVGTGLATSLARPGGNITGFTLAVGNDVAGKRLQLIKELLPKASRVAWLRPMAGYRDTPAEGWELIEAAGRERGAHANRLWRRLRSYSARTPRCYSRQPKLGQLPKSEVYRGVRCSTALTCYVFERRFYGHRRPDFLWRRNGRSFPPCGGICRQNSEGHQAWRLTHRAANQIRAEDQPQDRE